MPEQNFAGLHVAAFESRRRDDMAGLIERFGGVPHVSPSLREVPIAENRAAIDFANRLITGQVDIVIFMTGVGIRHLLAEIERHVDRTRFLEALSDIVTVVRGPKPVVVLKELGIEPTHRVPEPNTWREVLATIDKQIPVVQQNVAVQEYGQSNASLVAGLEARGARVQSVHVYRWELPEDISPLEENIKAIAAGQIDVSLFTSSHQIVNLLRVAQQNGSLAMLRQGLSQTVVGSIGPTTSETLREFDMPVDFEPEHAKMGHLVQAAAGKARRLLSRKRQAFSAALRDANRPAIVARPNAPPSGPWDDSLFMKACRREPVSRTPIWLMRQAGRYMEEYRRVRERTTFLELCKNPQLCAEVMITAVNRLGVDAAIIFSDLLPILEPMGFELEFAKGEGPVIHNPIRASSDVDRVMELETVESLSFVTDTVKLTRAGLPDQIPVIGFAGAPFTLASYAIEGGASRNFLHTKRLMYRDEVAWNELLGRLARSVARYLNAQIEAGAQAVQLFDSWVGCLGTADYRRYVLPHVKAIFAALPAGVPAINFATGNPALLPLLAQAGGSVIGIDWRIGLDDAWRLVGHETAVQGNLDPAVLLTDRDEIRRRTKEVLDLAAGRPGHIFNLGHGIHPQTPVDNVIALINAVHDFSGR
jgi:uroporphyrinogen decarboxylase